MKITNDGQFLSDRIEPSIAVLRVTCARIYCIHWVVTIVTGPIALLVTIHCIRDVVGAGVVRIGHSGIVEAGAGMLVANKSSFNYNSRLAMKCVVTCTASRCRGCGLCIWSGLEDGCCMNIEV